MLKIKITTPKGTITVCNTNKYNYPSDIKEFVLETITKAVNQLNK
jgi:hypothetical protein